MTQINPFAARLAAPLAVARSESARGRRVIGYIGDDIPVALILAADALPVRLSGVPQATPLADRYLESSFGPASRSLLEQWLRGELDFLEAIIFPRTNDSAQRLYYYASELQRRGIHRGPRLLIYDIARVNRDTSRAHTIAATHALAAQVDTTLTSLDAAVTRVRERARFIHDMSKLRCTTPGVSSADFLSAWRCMQLDWTEEFEATVRDWCASAPRALQGKRLLFAGSTPPDERFHRSAEQFNCNISDELCDESPTPSVLRWLNSRPSLDAIADAYHAALSTAATLLQSPDVLVERARNIGADGVVLWLVEEDEGIVWEVPRQLARLRQAGIPVLSLTRQRWDADSESLAAVAEFARTLKENR
jgi:benzoyl-CoA reductase/2-hydroxyglutaryl-CoA dehydratase subunit BcrC/BadD/HgdB